MARKRNKPVREQSVGECSRGNGDGIQIAVGRSRLQGRCGHGGPSATGDNPAGLRSAGDAAAGQALRDGGGSSRAAPGDAWPARACPGRLRSTARRSGERSGGWRRYRGQAAVGLAVRARAASRRARAGVTTRHRGSTQSLPASPSRGRAAPAGARDRVDPPPADQRHTEPASYTDDDDRPTSPARACGARMRRSITQITAVPAPRRCRWGGLGPVAADPGLAPAADLRSGGVGSGPADGRGGRAAAGRGRARAIAPDPRGAGSYHRARSNDSGSGGPPSRRPSRP